MINGHTVVGVRDLANLLQTDSKNINWNAKKKTIVIQAKDKNIELVINQKYTVIDGRTVLPTAVIARIMDIDVQYDTSVKELSFTITK